jgi:uncharacterized protein YggU (UPF0235/DUF167 family)
VSTFRAAIHVSPGARSDAVGGRAGAAGDDHAAALAIRVRARPVDGAATAAAQKVLARALSLRTSQVRVVRGSHSRHKLVEISDPPADLAAQWEALLDA